MNDILNTNSSVRGDVVLYSESKSGHRTILCEKHNTVLSSSNGILSKILAGNTNYIPSHIVFVASKSNLATLTASRTHSYDDLVEGSADTKLVVAELLAPTVSGVGDGSSVTFTTHTGLGDTSELSSGSSPHKYRRAILVCRLSGSSEEYIPFSVVDFSSPIDYTSNAYLGLYWKITFGTAS